MSQLSMIYKTVNESIFEEDLFPAALIQTVKEKEFYEGKVGKSLILFDEVKKCAEVIGCDANHIYFSAKGFDNYYYYNFPSFVPLVPLDIEVLKEDNFWADMLNQQIKVRFDEFNKSILEGDFKLFFSLADPRIHILGLTKLYLNIPDEKKYDWFIQVYTSVDYGFSRIPAHIIEDAFSKRSQEKKDTLIRKLDSIFPNEEIVIYRGQQEHSTPIEKAMSWTVNPYIASRFSSYFTGDGEVYSAKVKKEDVIDFLTERNEDEILIYPSDIYDIENMNMVKTSEEIYNMKDNGGNSLYHHYISQFDESLFFNPNGIHGVKHMKRVLYHIISISNALNLDDFDIRILCLAALYHDIGRTDDGEDLTHGDKSWEKIKRLELLEKTNDYYQDDEIDDFDKQIVEFIIRNHCLNDNTALENLDKINHLEKERIRFLFKVFCDCDGLDRVRLKDLDVSYLRLKESKRRVNFAFGLLRNIE